MVKPTDEVQSIIRKMGGSELKDGIRAADLLRRPEMTYNHIKQIDSMDRNLINRY